MMNNADSNLIKITATFDKAVLGYNHCSQCISHVLSFKISNK